eukprot:483955_1
MGHKGCYQAKFLNFTVTQIYLNMCSIQCCVYILLYCIIHAVTSNNNHDESHETVRIFLTGDIMIGRGVDQILRYPSDPSLAYTTKTAKFYITKAEEINGKFPSYETTSKNEYIWGDLMQSLNHYNPDVKLINLETTITTSNDYFPERAVHYRMHPQNIYTLKTLETHTNNNNLVCNIANNHILDYGYNGLNETIKTLYNNNISYVGVGLNINDAWKPVIIALPSKNCRIFIFGCGTQSGYIPEQWTATNTKSGINMVNPYNHSKVYIQNIMKHIKKHVLLYHKRDNMKNIIILTIHWGSHYAFQIEQDFITFAHVLIDYNEENEIGIDMIHGHSSHNIKGFEIYKNKAIFYGCGNFINDYEGRPSHSEFHKYLGFMYFVDLNVNNGNVNNVFLKGTHIKQFSITYAKDEYLMWLYYTINKLCQRFNISLYENMDDGTIHIHDVNHVLFDESVLEYNHLLMETAASVVVTHVYWLSASVFVTVNCLLYCCYVRFQNRPVDIEFHDQGNKQTIDALPYVD